MSRTKLNTPSSAASTQQETLRNDAVFQNLIDWLIPEGLFKHDRFHGNVKWEPEQLVIQALIWAWQETKLVTDAFDHTREACDDLGLTQTALTDTAFMNALHRYSEAFRDRLRDRVQMLAEEIGGDWFRTRGWVLVGFDGSRATAPRTVSNEKAFCAPNYGNGKRAKYGKKKSQGQRRQRNKDNPPQPQAPQAWITMMWHMSLRLPWTWRLGPSNSSERDHVKDMLQNEHFPDKTLFCGDAGFVGYPLWNAIVNEAGQDFVVRVGANVSLLSESADIEECGGGEVLCWPKGRMNSGDPPLRLRLVQVTVGKTKMWLLTSVLDAKQLPKKDLVKIYKMRWGIEVEFRGLKQTIEKSTLRCRNSDRLLVELDWSLRAMAVAELLALRVQLCGASDDYEPLDRSLANTLRALRKCLRRLHRYPDDADDLLTMLSGAVVQRYQNGTDKTSRYRRRNPDKKPLGDPTITPLTPEQLLQLQKHDQNAA